MILHDTKDIACLVHAVCDGRWEFNLKKEYRSTVAFNFTHFRRILILTIFDACFRHLLISRLLELVCWFI
jgi:hypothetical protein